MKKWQYCILRFEDNEDTATVQNALNQKGADGWELVSTMYSEGAADYMDVQHFFKRPIPS